MQLLCNSHFADAADRVLLQIIKQAESAIGLKRILTSAQPHLKSFLGKTCFEAALLAFTKIACNDGHKSSLFVEFNDLLDKKKKQKKFTILKVCILFLNIYSGV
jgi:hypothetical protein